MLPGLIKNYGLIKHFKGLGLSIADSLLTPR